MQVYEGGETKLCDLKPSLQLFDLEYCLGLSVVIENVSNLAIHFEEATVPGYFAKCVPKALLGGHVGKHQWSEANQYLKEQLWRNVCENNRVESMLHDSIGVEVTDKEVQKPIEHKNDVEVDQQIEALLFEPDFSADHNWRYNYPHHKDDLSEVVPLHVPVVLRVDNELAYLVSLRLLVLVLPVVVFVALVALAHFLDGFTAHAGHHADNLFLFANGCPKSLSSVDFGLLLVSCREKLFQELLLMLPVVLFGF
jgi:hypothetical protein